MCVTIDNAQARCAASAQFFPETTPELKSPLYLVRPLTSRATSANQLVTTANCDALRRVHPHLLASAVVSRDRQKSAVGRKSLTGSFQVEAVTQSRERPAPAIVKGLPLADDGLEPVRE